MKIPSYLWHLQGKDQDGPNTLILGGTHGDELTGIEVVRQILQRLQLLSKTGGSTTNYEIRGNLYIGFGNPEAILRRTRAASGNKDLNRSFIPAELAKKSHTRDSLDLRRARELAPLLRDIDILLDLHATSNPAPSFVCCTEASERHLALCEHLDIKYVLTDPDQLVSKEFQSNIPGTTDYYVDAYGGSRWSKATYGKKLGTAICYETGHEADTSKVKQVLNEVLSELIKQKTFTAKKVKSIFPEFIPSKRQKVAQSIVYSLTYCYRAEATGFHYKKGMDKGWQRVSKGQLLGHYLNGRRVTIDRSGMMVFPLAAHKVVPGKALYWIATSTNEK